MKKKNVINQNKINPPAGATWMIRTAGDLVSSDIRILAPLILEMVAWLQLSFAGLPINLIPV